MVRTGNTYHLRWVIDVEFQDYEVGVIGYMMCTAETKVPRVCAPHGAIGEFRSGMRKNAQPPLEEKRRVTQRR